MAHADWLLRGQEKSVLPSRRCERALRVFFRADNVSHILIMFSLYSQVRYVTNLYYRTAQNFQIISFLPVIQMVTKPDCQTMVGVLRGLELNIFKLIFREFILYLILQHLGIKSKQSGQRHTSYNTVVL